jgi:hypothetical protein
LQPPESAEVLEPIHVHDGKHLGAEDRVRTAQPLFPSINAITIVAVNIDVKAEDGTQVGPAPPQSPAKSFDLVGLG